MPQKKVRITALPPEDAAIANVLMNRNRGKNFVDRAYNNNTAPRLQTNKIPVYGSAPSNMYSTELMAYDVNPDGTGRVYPEIVQKPGDKKLTYLGGDKAWDYADSTGEYITTPNAKTADMLSNYGYKKATGIPIKQKGGKAKQLPPIYVDSPNDPRYRAHQDSINIYQEYMNWRNSHIKAGHQIRTDSEGIPEKGIEGVVTFAEKPSDQYTKWNYPKRISPIQEVRIKNTNPKEQIQKLSKQEQKPLSLQQMQYVNVPPMPDIRPEGWYSNSQNIPIDAPDEEVQKLYNEDGTRKYQQGGPTMKKVRITATPGMEFGGKLPETGNNINSPNVAIPNMAIDTRWRYFAPGDVYAYAPDAFATKRQLPESSNPDIVVEKKEQVIGDFDGDGQQELMGVNTGTHDSGNDQGINVPDNSFVFSDTQALKIKDKDTLKQFGKSKAATPAQLAKQYDLQSASKLAQDPKSDRLSQKTGEMMYNNYLGKLNKLADVQEGMKQVMAQKKQMKMGGMPQYATGGYGPTYKLYDSAVQPPMNIPGLTDIHPEYNISATRGSDTAGQYSGLQQMPTDIAQYNPTGVQVPGMPPVSMGETDDSTKRVKVTGVPTNGTRTGNFLRNAAAYGRSADALGDAALGLKALNLQKFKPWEPPVTAVIPEAVYTDPTRELAANSEQAAMAYNAASQSANSKAARAAGATYQGQAIRNAADTLGRYNNQNVQISNQANQQAAGITNQMLEQQRERAKSLNSDMFNANRLYQGELNQLSDEMVKRAYQKEDSARNRAWINKTNPYIQLDRNNMPHFNGPNGQAAVERMYNMQNGIGSPDANSYKMLKAEYDKAVAAGLDPDTAQEAAWKNVYGTRERTTYDRNNMQKSKTISGTRNQKLGGFTSNQIRRFIEGR